MVAAISVLLISSFAASGSAMGQAPDQKESGVVVTKNNWHKGIRGSDLGRSIFDQSAARRNPNVDDPFQQMRQVQRRMAMRVDGYYYSATVRNDGTKPVKALVWDYTIADPRNPESLTHHRFYSRIDIRPGKHKEVYRFAVTPPTRTVSAAKGNAHLIEEVVVNAVQYKDGSVWKLRP